MMGLSPMELVVILVLIVLLFGVKRLPELGTGLGLGISNFRKSFREGSAIDVTPKPELEKAEAQKKEGDLQNKA
jgi:sec-independent protein translocase protein TatA